MRFATLSDYIDIITKLAKEGPLKTSELQSLLAVERQALENALNFLLGQRMIEKIILGRESTGYTVTARGSKILTFFDKSGSGKP